MEELSRSHPVWFCDIWGVVHNGFQPFAPTVDSLQRHRNNGGTVILVSNSPRSTIGITRQLDDIGIPRDAYDAAVTSGDVTRDLMRRQSDGKLYHLGPDRDLSIFDGLNVERVPLERASAVICTGLFHEERETPADYDGLFAEIKSRTLTMICANPDRIVRKGGRLIYCAGALAERYAALGGEVLMAGKPFAPIYELARRVASDIRKTDVAPAEILAIGDGPQTDIRGAAEQGIDCVFVTGLEDHEVTDLPAAHASIRQAVPQANVLKTVARLDWR